MKKNYVYALMGAIALVGAVGLASCSSSDEIVDNPNYDPETNTVKTQFAISIPVGGGQQTRMAADGAPDNGVFKGMTNIKLYPFKTTTTNVEASSAIVTPITLGVIAEGGLDKKGTESNKFNGKVYEDVKIPVGTNNFLFYGQITDPQGGALTATYGENGTPAANISFALNNISTLTMASANTDTQGAAVLTALNAIVAELKKQLSAAEAAPHESAIQLNVLLSAFKNLKAGSANSVMAFVQNSYNFLKGQTGGYAAAVITKIETYFTVSGSSTPYSLSWATENTFPNNIYLPDGAIGLAYTDNPTTAGEYYSYASVTTNSNSQPELNTYVKPAALHYYVNTPLKADVAAHASQYNSQTSWADVVALYTSGTAVESSTRGIVLVNPIQYGVGRLKAKVTLGSTLYANNENGVQTEVTPPTDGYTITGILIGSQKNVDWKFEPTGTGTYTIYDPVWTDGTNNKATTTGSGFNYTLALQSEKDDIISIAVELKNDGADFYGIDNRLIPKDSKFYLIAKIDPKHASSSAYNADDNTKNRVFCQDVETTVEFTIGTNSLKKAYNVIPDLREAKLELGLSVDLNWTTGLSFTSEFGE